MNVKKAKRILIVDDEITYTKLMEMILKSDHIETVGANDGNRALELLHSNSIDLIVLDVMMRGFDGLELLKHIRLKLHILDIPIVLMSALSEDNSQFKKIKKLYNAFIQKPSSPTDIRSIINSLLLQKK